jgi:hypothetical protein
VEWPRTRRLTCPGQLVCFSYYYFLLFITKYNISVLHDYDNENKRRRRVWTASDEWYDPGHVKRRVLGNWYVFIIITFYFSLLNIIFKYYMTTTTEISDVGGSGQRATSGTTQDTSFDVSWAIGVFLLLFFITNYNIQVLNDYDNENMRRRRVCDSERRVEWPRAHRLTRPGQ